MYQPPRWVNAGIDLTDWLRLQYSPLALQGDKPTEVKLYRSTNVKTVINGGLISTSTDDEYKKALGLMTENPPKNTMTG